MKRRSFLKRVAVVSSIGITGLLNSSLALAEKHGNDPFKAKSLEEVLKILGGIDAEVSDKIKLKAPEIAENGAVVPVGVASKIEGTTEISLITVENPTPLAAKYLLGEGAVPSVKSRFKMGKTTDVVVLVKAGDKFYTTKANVKVTKGGCGG